jgi:hypothetical protein
MAAFAVIDTEAVSAHDFIEARCRTAVVVELDGYGPDSIEPVEIGLKQLDLRALDVNLQEVNAVEAGVGDDTGDWQALYCLAALVALVGLARGEDGVVRLVGLPAFRRDELLLAPPDRGPQRATATGMACSDTLL